MNVYIKMFIVGYLSGIITTLASLTGCYIYRCRIRKSSADTGGIGETEQRQSDTCGKLAENERTAAELIQKAKNILNNGKYINNN